MLTRILPLIGVARAATRTSLRRDLVAGLTVALFTVPQGMAYALIAGMPPAAGVWSSVAASILGAAFGSSEFLMNGPTNAMSVLLAANVAVFAAGGGDPARLIVVLTLAIGVGQLVAALARVGKFSRFVSEPVLTGFTAGAGLYIAVNQLPALFGLHRSDLTSTLLGWKPPGNCVFDLVRVVVSLTRANAAAFAVGAGTLLIVRGLQRLEKKINRRLPAPFLAIAIVTLASWCLGLGEVARGASKLSLVRDIEPITRSLPSLVLPHATFAELRSLAAPAFAIGLLGAVEALAIGKTLAARAGHTFDANRQLVGEAACNIGAALVGGFASSGSFTRSAVNFEAGAVSRLSCVFSGGLVLVLILVFAPAANLIPTAALAGTLVHVGIKLVNVGKLRLAIEATTSDRLVVYATFATVLLSEHLQYALFVGIIVSVVQALRRAEGFQLAVLVEDARGNLVEKPFAGAKLGEIAAVDVQGEMFFAAAEELEARLVSILAGDTRYLVVRIAQAYNLDLTCAEAIGNVARRARERGGRLLLAGVRPGARGTLERARVLEAVGADAVFDLKEELLVSTVQALHHARRLAGRHIPLAHWP